MRTAPRHVHFYSVMNRKSSAAKAKLTMEKQLEIVRQKLILLTWLLKTGGRGRQMERWHGEENRILTWSLGPGACGPFSFSLRAREEHSSLIMNRWGDGYQEPVNPEVWTFSTETWHGCFQGQVTTRLPCSCYEKNLWFGEGMFITDQDWMPR